jgi:hypothetical protein
VHGAQEQAESRQQPLDGERTEGDGTFWAELEGGVDGSESEQGMVRILPGVGDVRFVDIRWWDERKRSS